jgi:hypothetical protein
MAITTFRDPATLAVVFSVILHAILIAAAFGIALLVWAVIAKFPAPEGRLRQEIIMRSVAATAGVLLVLGSRAVGVSIPAFMLNALLLGGFYLTGVIGSIVPAAAGFAVAWVVISRFNSRNESKNLVSARLLAMLLAVVPILYCDSYALSADAVRDEAHAGAFRLLLPNLTLILAALVLAVFTFNPTPLTEPRLSP